GGPAARRLVLPSRLEFAGSAPGPRSARAMRASRGRSEFRIWGLALGYFGSYIPYSGLTKALTQGSLPGTGGPTTGFTILPGTVIGTTVLLLVLITAMGGWRSIDRSSILGLRIPVVSGWMLPWGVAPAVIIGTTTLN